MANSQPGSDHTQAPPPEKTSPAEDDRSDMITPRPILLEDRAQGSGATYSSALDSARDQDWSFVDL